MFRKKKGIGAAVAALLLLLALGMAAQKTKNVSGKIRTVKENVLSLQKAGLVSESYVTIETDKDTKVKGQILPGLHIKAKYRELDEKDAAGEKRKVAVEIETRPEYASKEARKAAKQIEKQ